MEQEKSRGSRRRRHYTPEEKQLVVKLYEESGLSQAEFCEKEGVAIHNLRRWQQQQGNDEPGTRLVEVEARQVSVSKSGGIYRMGFEGGGWLEFGSGFDCGEVRALLEILRC